MEIFNKSTNILHKNKPASKPYSEILLNKAHLYSKYWSYLPFVKEVYVCNSVAIGNAHSNSDIDLLIISQKNSMFLARLFWMLFFYMSFQRSFFSIKFGRICPSFWIDGDFDLIDSVSNEVDPYISIWKKNLICIKSYPNKSYSSFLKFINFTIGKLMLFRITSSKKFKKAPEGAVVVNFRVLKLHFNDKRKAFLNSLVDSR
jgi:hypothetical protein